jgi:hypothetical protein
VDAASMTYQSDTQGSFYLISILSFNVGTQVTLYGTIQVTTAKDFWFVLSKDMVINPKLLPAGAPTPSVDAPFGMTGVTLDDFEVKAHIYKDKDSSATKTDLRVNASAHFSGFNLSGAIVFENGSPRLTLASLSADPALTLTQFYQSVTGGTWPWMDGVTNQFAFQSGDIYYLNPPANAPSDYTYNYQYKDRQFTCSPGYRIDAVLQIFQRYNFHITLSVGSPASGFGGSSTIDLQGTALNALDFDFIVIKNLSLSLSITPLSNGMSIGADITLLGTDIGHLDASYDSASQAFGGEIQGGLLPSPITSVAFVWTQGGGFIITSIGGLPDQLLDFMKFVDALNKLLSGGCQKILNEWFKDLSTTLKVTTNGSPSRSGSTMNVPLTLRYEITAPGGLSNSGNIDFPVNFPLPRHLDGLFGAIGQSLLNNMEGIAGKILANPDTYKVIAAYVATTYGKQALARLICRALDTPELSSDPDTAKDLSKTDAPGDTLEGAAELAAQITRVALLDVPQIVTGLVGVLGLISELADKLKNFFGSIAAKLGLEHEKSDAEDKRDDFHQQIATQCQHAQDVLNNLLAEVNSYKGAIQIKQLDLRLDQGNVYVATWRPANRNFEGVVPPAAVVCELRLLDKDRNTLWSSSTDGGNPLYANQTPCTIQRKDIHTQVPVVYASIAPSIANLQLMDDMTKRQIGSVLDQLDGANDDVATDWAQQLRSTLQSIPNQVVTSPVSTMLLGMYVGNSFIGINTRI